MIVDDLEEFGHLSLDGQLRELAAFFGIGLNSKEMEALTRDRYRKEGIPLNTVTLKDIAETAKQLRVDSELVPWDTMEDEG